MYKHTLTSGSVLCVCVCSSAKGTVSYRERALYAHAPTKSQMHTSTHPLRPPSTLTCLCVQSSHHLVTQSCHLWVPFDGLHKATDRPQGVQSAFVLQTSMENLILLCCVLSFCDGSLVFFIINVSFVESSQKWCQRSIYTQLSPLVNL